MAGLPVSQDILTVQDTDIGMERSETSLPGSGNENNSEANARFKLWLLANGCGLAAYLISDFWMFVPQPEGDALNGIDIIGRWLTINFPLLLSFLVANVFWLISLIRRYRSEGQWRPLLIWLFVCLGWLAVPVCDGTAATILAWLLVVGRVS